MAAKLKESERKYESLFATANDAIFLADGDTGMLIDVNEKGEELTGRSRDELIGMHQSKLHPPEQEEKIKKSFEDDTRIGNNTRYKEWDVLHKDGTLIPVEIVPTVIELKGRKAVMGIFRDVTERRQYEQSLEKALEEKEALLREINHRVKNNLTMISALLRLKASSMGDEIDLSDVEHQIDAIRIVHEKLLMSEHISYIDLKVYVQELLETIFASFSNRRVDIVNSIPEMFIPTNQAVSLGLIINEIATNAIKHGFKDDELALFSIDLKNEGQNGHYICTLTNSGNPFPEEIDLETSNSLGLKIITLLVEQLEGKIHLRKQPNPEYILHIPLTEPAVSL
jgi:PAS domain S-box-containing protein